MYKSPFDITNKMLNLSISITEKIGLINSFSSLKRMPILRKNNKILIRDISENKVKYLVFSFVLSKLKLNNLLLTKNT